MATLQRRSDYPNLLLISGTDLLGTATDPNGQPSDVPVPDWRQRVKNLLFSDTNGVRNFSGEVDFIICYFNAEIVPDHAGVDHNLAGRPLRGIIALPGHDLNQTADLTGIISGGIGHEVGHYWLVPSAARISTTSGPVPTPTPDEVAESLNRGAGLPPYTLIGRMDAHWSPYLDSRNSPMDGINHSPAQQLLEQAYGYAFATGEETTGVPLDLPGGGSITTRTRYSDLELYIMGVLRPPDFVPANAIVNSIRANWVFPLDFQAGLYVEASSGQKWYVGFDRGPHQLRAQAVDGTASAVVPLRVPFNPRDLVATRVVQRGSSFVLQVRLWRGADPLEGCAYEVLRRLGAIPFLNPHARPSKLSCSDILGDLARGSLHESSDPYTGWKTLLTLNGRATQVGIGARHLSGVCFAQMQAELCGVSGGTVTPVPFSQMAGTNLLNQTSPLYAKTILPDGSFVLPYRTTPGGVTSQQHTTAVDQAPRLSLATPAAGDFGFGAWLQLVNCCIVTWAGRGGIGRTYIGVREQFRFDQFDFLPAWGTSAAVRQAPPPANTYKFLFCFLSRVPLPDSTLLPKLTRLDLNRKLWEPCFAGMTKGQRNADTVIP